LAAKRVPELPTRIQNLIMKKNIIILLALFIGAAAYAQDGIVFVDKGTAWDDILAKAKTENKLIFMDAYTTWCGPCKKMTREVFPQKIVGDYYNDHFINVKMDMEKGEGVELAQRYSVQAYPTLLFISFDGSLVHRKAGYMEPPEFIALGKEASDPSRSLSAMEKRYNKGERDPVFLMEYTKARYNAADGSHSAIANEYLDTQDDFSTPENMKFLFRYVEDAESEGFDYIMKNREGFEEMFGPAAVAQKVQSLIYNKIYYTDPPPTLEEIEGIFQKFYPEKSGLLFANFKMSYYRQLGDREGYAKSAIERFDKFPSKDYSEYNEAAWTFYLVIDDKKQLKEALKWSKKSVKMAYRYENTDTVAHLYYKLGKKKAAAKWAKKSIAVAKSVGEDYRTTQELLDKIEEGK
jgi:thioredoxin-related protein